MYKVHSLQNSQVIKFQVYEFPSPKFPMVTKFPILYPSRLSSQVRSGQQQFSMPESGFVRICTTFSNADRNFPHGKGSESGPAFLLWNIWRHTDIYEVSLHLEVQYIYEVQLYCTYETPPLLQDTDTPIRVTSTSMSYSCTFDVKSELLIRIRILNLIAVPGGFSPPDSDPTQVIYL